MSTLTLTAASRPIVPENDYHMCFALSVEPFARKNTSYCKKALALCIVLYVKCITCSSLVPNVAGQLVLLSTVSAVGFQFAVVGNFALYICLPVAVRLWDEGLLENVGTTEERRSHPSHE